MALKRVTLTSASLVPFVIGAIFVTQLVVLSIDKSPLGQSFASQVLQSISILMACAVAARAGHRSRDFARTFWLFSSAGFALLFIALLVRHFEHGEGFGASDYFFLLHMAPFGLALLLNDRSQPLKAERWPLLLDYAQILLITAVVFLALIYIPSKGASVAYVRSLYATFAVVLIVRNVSVTAGFCFRSLMGVSERERNAFGAMSIYLVVYTAGSALTHYVFLSRYPQPPWIELEGSVPFLAGVWLFWRWQDSPASVDREPRGFRKALTLHLIPAVLPLTVAALALWISQSAPRLAWAAVGGSLGIFTIRLLLTLYFEYQANEAARHSEERYRSLALATAQIIWTANNQGEIVTDQPMWAAFSGMNSDETRGHRWMAAVHPDEYDAMSSAWQKAVENGNAFQSVCRLRRHDGVYRDMEMRGVPVLGSRGQIREWVGTCTDITQRRQAEAEIKRLNENLEERVRVRTAELQTATRELEAFTYSVSHDLRAPLRAINGFASILATEHQAELSPPALELLERVRQSGVHMGALVDDLLALSRLGRQALKKRTVAMNEVVRLALDDLRTECAGREIEFAIQDLPSCESDALLVRQVFVNLLSNSIKYTRPREKARIEVGMLRSSEIDLAATPQAESGFPDGRNAPIFYVRDNGIGFDMRYASRLFRVFERLHAPEQFEGTGIGLATVQRIIQRHGGRVWAESAPNQGATFYFTLESAENTPASPVLSATA